MREKVENLVYLNPENYVTRGVFLNGNVFMLLLSAFLFVGACVTQLTAAIVSLALWYIVLFFTVYLVFNKRTVKSFQLRFLVNGLSALIISSFFLLITYVLDDAFKTNLFWWILVCYILCVCSVLGLTVLGVHKDWFKKMREFNKTPIAIRLTNMGWGLIPVAAVLGKRNGRRLDEAVEAGKISEEFHSLIVVVTCSLVSFLTTFGFMNFVQYYYCKKYNITCDEHGDPTSPNLERQPKQKRSGVEKKLGCLSKIFIVVGGLLFLLFIVGLFVHE